MIRISETTRGIIAVPFLALATVWCYYTIGKEHGLFKNTPPSPANVVNHELPKVPNLYVTQDLEPISDPLLPLEDTKHKVLSSK